MLGQRWVSDVALGSFRGSQGTPFSLEAWFERDPVRWVDCSVQLGWWVGCGVAATVVVGGLWGRMGRGGGSGDVQGGGGAGRRQLAS